METEEKREEIFMDLQEQIIGLLQENKRKPLRFQKMLYALPEADAGDVADTLRQLTEAGVIQPAGHKRYILAEEGNLLTGKIAGNEKGFAFLRCENREEDIFIAAKNLHGALHNDMVVVRVFDEKETPGKSEKRKRGEKNRHNRNDRNRGKEEKLAATHQEGTVVKVLERANQRIVGVLVSGGKTAFVTPDERKLGTDIYIPANRLHKAKVGDKVVVEIFAWAKKDRAPEGKIIEVLGKEYAPGVDMMSIIRQYDLPLEFPQQVLDEADRVSVITEEDKIGREDWRNVVTCTIDGDDAKDLDDAISLEPLSDGGWELGVHIADVGHYVPVRSALDREAFNRATSVYLPDRVIPMLPTQLSNHICSLNAGVDRLSLSCIMEIDPSGKVTKHRIAETVICVDRRLSYSLLNRALVDREEAVITENKDWYPRWQMMEQLAKVLREKKQKRGALDFNFPETKILFHEDGSVKDVVKRTTSVAENIIEEFMILANETVAADFHRKKIPFLYRIHEKPDGEKILALGQMIAPWGYRITLNKDGEVTPKAIGSLLKKVAGAKEEKLIQIMALRSMKHARYSTEALGHFGLASKYYSHFTSPIRRYPDLAIHRVIKDYLHGGNRGEEVLEKLQARLSQYATQSSIQEKVAEDSERDAVQAKCCAYMSEHIGEAYAGTISGVTNYGFYVELENSIEGLVHVNSLIDDHYDFVEAEMLLRGSRTYKEYRLGDGVEIQVKYVDMERKLIDFMLKE